MVLSRIRTASLKFMELRALDQEIQRGFGGWVDGAPDTYTDDGFIVDRTPLVITSQYGQNQDIGITAADVAADQDNNRQGLFTDTIYYDGPCDPCCVSR